MPLNNNGSTHHLLEAPIEAIVFPVPLFLSPAFLRRFNKEEFCTFQWVNNTTGITDAYVSFVLEESGAYSLPQSPFGSFYSLDTLSLDEAQAFVEAVKTTLTEKGCKEMIIKHYPNSYGAYVGDLFFKAMQDQGFEVLYEELNQYLSVTESLYTNSLHDSELRRLKKCIQADFEVEVSKTYNVDEWFNRIERARVFKGHPLTIDLNGLKNISGVCPEKYHFVSVKDQGKTIASAIAIEVTKDVLYYYLPADEQAYQQYSPMVMLIEALYNLAQHKNMKIVDLGISSSKGIINEGLRKFKNNLGAKEEAKFWLKVNL